MDVPFLAHLEILSSAFFQIFWNFVRIIRPYFLTTWNRNCNERKYVANKWVELTRERERIILLPLITWKSLVEKWKKKKMAKKFPTWRINYSPGCEKKCVCEMKISISTTTRSHVCLGTNRLDTFSKNTVQTNNSIYIYISRQDIARRQRLGGDKGT